MKKNSIYKIPFTALLAFACLGFFACKARQVNFAEERAKMVKQQIENRGIRTERLLNAFLKVPREEFVLPKFRPHSYEDVEVPIGFDQTLNRPYEDAVLIDALSLGPADRVLEIGTGSGYGAALIAHIAGEVFTIEIEAAIAENARANLARVGLSNIKVMTGDGFLGWPKEAPFDAIILNCSPSKAPPPLVEQLKEGGRLILPLGGEKKFQDIVLYEKKDGKLVEIRHLAPTTFGPMKGKAAEDEQK